MQELVRDAVRLLEGVVLPADEAATLARLVGSRGELLAHLLVCRRSLRAWPDIVEALMLAAAEVGPGPISDRPERSGDAAHRRADYEHLDASLRRLFADAVAKEAHDKASSALQQFRSGAAGRK